MLFDVGVEPVYIIHSGSVAVKIIIGGARIQSSF